MSRSRSSTVVSFKVAALLVVLLGVLATLQYRWIGQVSEAESERMKRNLATAGGRFVRDFDSEIGSLLGFFRNDPAAGRRPRRELAAAEVEEVFARKYDSWQANKDPRLIEELLLIFVADGGFELRRFNPASRRFEGATWSRELAPLRRRFGESASAPARGPGWGPLFHLPQGPAFLLPASFARSGSPRDRSGRGLRIDAYALVRLNLSYIQEHLLPTLVARHFPAEDALEYDVAVVGQAGPGGQRLLYSSDPALEVHHFRTAEIVIGLLVMRPEFATMGGRFGQPDPSGPLGQSGQARGVDMAASGRPGGLSSHWPRPPRGPQEGPWRLAVALRRGSLEAVVARARAGNLALSLGTLLFLAGTVAALVVATQRAQKAAAQQLEFVAGVTHEIHTPLAAIRAAGENLADGLVNDPQQVRRYGALIHKEGNRLTELVGQALEMAGIQSGQRTYQLRETEIGGVLKEAMEDCRDLFVERSMRFEEEIPADLPAVYADSAALRRVFQNLLTNAVKYSPPMTVVRIGAAAVRGPRGREVRVTVIDQGPGIPKDERSRIFEPFYRGQAGAIGSVAGNGIGLAVVKHLVEHQGGKIRVEPGPGGRGSAFVVRLPAFERQPEGARLDGADAVSGTGGELSAAEAD